MLEALNALPNSKIGRKVKWTQVTLPYDKDNEHSIVLVKVKGAKHPFVAGIDNGLVNGKSGQAGPVFNPADAVRRKKLPQATLETLNQAAGAFEHE